MPLKKMSHSSRKAPHRFMIFDCIKLVSLTAIDSKAAISAAYFLIFSVYCFLDRFSICSSVSTFCFIGFIRVKSVLPEEFSSNMMLNNVHSVNNSFRSYMTLFNLAFNGACATR